MLSQTDTLEITPSTETGKLQIMHLKRYWNKAMLKRNGKLAQNSFYEECPVDDVLLSILGLGLEQVLKYLYNEAPTFSEFEDWILVVSGAPDPDKADHFNQLIIGKTDDRSQAQVEQVLTVDDLNFWNENGYLIIRNAVSKTDCDDTIRVLCEHIGVDRYDASTWYNPHPDRQGIMVQLFQHPILNKNRNSVKIRKVYEQLWNRTDLFVNSDRVGFNPPQTPTHQFQGPRLHWDSSIALPIPFALQGILYLADTAEDQGAFTLVPGFQNRIADWLNSLPPDANPRTQDLYALGTKPIAANAGDFIVWHHALPHGSSPNTNTVPRFVQYFTYVPIDKQESDVWK